MKAAIQWGYIVSQFSALNFRYLQHIILYQCKYC